VSVSVSQAKTLGNPAAQEDNKNAPLIEDGKPSATGKPKVLALIEGPTVR
jgi:hypothetical protein